MYKFNNHHDMMINSVSRCISRPNFVVRYVLSFVLVLCAMPFAFGITYETRDYAVVDGDTLRMDIYHPVCRTQAPAPAVIFAFGGGFMSGTRDNNEYLQYFQFLNDNGIAVISVDYRTSLLKHFDENIDSLPERFATALVYAINDAVSDFYRATTYVLENASELGVDDKKLFASGSSAGAITALQAEYWRANGYNMGVALPQDFNYAGIVAFAGAVFCNDDLVWKSKPCPMMLFHGDADKNVPYSVLSAGGMSLCGSQYIAKTLASIDTPCEFYSFEGKDHVLSVSPMHDNLYSILGFILRVCDGKQNASVNATEFIPGATKDYRTDFSIEDYIKANMQ